MSNKIWILPANESWICDRMVSEFYEFNNDITTRDINEASTIWLFSDWMWRHVQSFFSTKNVVATIHHIVPEKFGIAERKEFDLRDSYISKYHVFNERAFKQVSQLTEKPITIIPYWCNQHIWKATDTKENLRKKYGISNGKFIIGSFQRDSEGSDLTKPKLEKGPDLLADLIEKYHEISPNNVEVVLAGCRRDYLIDRLKKRNIPFKFFERPEQSVINDLYQTLDLYPVTARHEGGPQALLECGLLNVQTVSRPVGIAEQVLPPSSIHDNVFFANSSVPNVESMKIPHAFSAYRKFLLDA
jgi:hypothetical protein